MIRMFLFCTLYFLISCAGQTYHNESIDLHNRTYHYRVFGNADLGEVRDAIQTLKGSLEKDEFIYTVWMVGGVVKVHTVKGLPKYQDGNAGFSYSLKRENGEWSQTKDEGQWIS